MLTVTDNMCSSPTVYSLVGFGLVGFCLLGFGLVWFGRVGFGMVVLVGKDFIV